MQTLPVLLIPLGVALCAALIIRFTMSLPGPPPGMQFPERRGDPIVPITVLVVFFSAFILLIRVRRPTISALILIGIWTLITTTGALLFGVSSVFPALLLIPICTADLLIDGVASISLAALSTVLVGCIALLESQGLLVRPTFGTSAQLPGIIPLSFGFWSAMFWTIAALTSLLAGNLQRALKRSRAQANELKTLSDQLEARVTMQTAKLLTQEREAAILEERTRLARDIHDTLAQGLTSIVVQLGAAQQLLAAETAIADEQIDLAQRMARESLAEARRSVWNLRSPILERGDLADALRSIVARPINAETATSFVQRGSTWPLTSAVESALLRVAQEALVNVAKHANASAVVVALEYTDTAVQVQICDDGDGIDPAAVAEGVMTPGLWGGFGLLGMRERLSALGGTLEIKSDNGTTVIATVPRAHRPVPELKDL